ncbi:MAG: hypothetical protein SW833_11175 [Cyanobacteriota bacterium]|nr:hypothetical protein [Cyanobacteriota bacterium]
MESFDYVTVLTSLGKYKSEFENLRIFENFFSRQKIEYFDIPKNLESIGYTDSDLHFKFGNHSLKNRFSLYFSQEIPKEMLMIKPATEEVSLNYEIRVKEDRKYEFWWDYVGTMRTKGKKTSGALCLSLSRRFTYFFEEICLYHPQVSYQRNGMNPQFYDDDIWGSQDIIDKAVVQKRIEKYALDKEESRRLLYDPFVEGQTFLRYW